MQAVADGSLPRSGLTPAVVAVGFGTTVAMWGVGYFGRLPALMLPSPVILALLLGCLVLGGTVAGARTSAGARAGGLVGAVSGVLNLLVILSFLAGEQRNALDPVAMYAIPGSILISVLLAAAGALLASRNRAVERTRRDWLSSFVKISVAATLLLLGVGGLVTSADAGLAVVDWPRSFGYNMFLYPFSKMTGGIYYEHAHRLIGFLVGLTTLVMAIFIQRVDPRAWVRRLGWLAVAMVVVQAALGGLRVTEINLGLAMTHGVLAQIFFSTLVALAVFTSRLWRSGEQPARRENIRTDRFWAGVLVALIVVQLVLGAAQRHLAAALMLHIVTGVAFVAPLALHVGMRAWGLNPGQKALQRLGLFLAGGVGFQLLLGLGSFAATGEAAVLPRGFILAVPTVHQWFGALLLGAAVSLACLSYRLLDFPDGSPSTG